jgi:putative nucleotidyltransferase with HDIG domain
VSASQSPGNFGRDEQDWFGGRDQEAEDAASKSLAATAARIVGAKPFPVAAKRLEELTRSNSARIEQVVVVLESDPALSARLLRLVNSAGYGLKVRCTSVRHAAVLVGTRRLNQVATTAAILDLFESSNSLAAELLEHAAVVGSLCRYLAVHLGLPHDELFTCGFLHDIGKIMLLDTERDVYPALLREFGGNADSVHEQERRVFGFDHATLGAHVLTAWNIPDPVPKVIAWHHQPARALQDSLLSAMVQTLRLADLLAYELGRRPEEEGIPLVAQSEAAQYLDISEPQLAAMWRDLASLRERSKARSHGEPELEAADPRLDVPQSLRPRGSLPPRTSRSSMAPTRGSLMPTDADAPGSVRPPTDGVKNDVPNKLACVVCGSGSYGNLCQACGGHVCPNHQASSDEWCSLCEDEFVEFKAGYRLPPSLLSGVAAVVILSLIGALVSAWSGGNTGLSALLAPLLLTVVWGIVLPIGNKLWLKLHYMRQLRPRIPPQPSVVAAGEELKPEGREQSISSEAQIDLPPVPSIVPDYDRSTLAPPHESFAAGLAAMLPPAEERQRSELPEAVSGPSTRPSSTPSPGPMVIRVEVPSFSPTTASLRPRQDSQLSAMARLAGSGPSVPPQSEADAEDRGDVSSVMPTAAASSSASLPPVEAQCAPTPASMVPPNSVAPQVSVVTLSVPPRRSEPPASLLPAAASLPPPRVLVSEPAPAPVLASIPAPSLAPTPIASTSPSPVLIPSTPTDATEPTPVVQQVLTTDVAVSDEQSGVRHVLLRNAPGVLREVCSPDLYRRCS